MPLKSNRLSWEIASMFGKRLSVRPIIFSASLGGEFLPIARTPNPILFTVGTQWPTNFLGLIGFQVTADLVIRVGYSQIG
jgi:hypothetical protein